MTNMLSILPKLTDKQKELFINYAQFMPIDRDKSIPLVKKKIYSVVELALCPQALVLRALEQSWWGIEANEIVSRQIIELLKREVGDV